VTNVASLSEEVANPERNLPLGIFLALATAIVVYGLATLVMVGVVPMATLAGDLTPMATAAKAFLGRWGELALAVAALLAFTSVANAGTLSASRYPLAMSRDRLLPPFFRRLTPQRIPATGLLSTVLVIVVTLALLDPAKIAKLASAFQLLMFALLCLAVIVMRESRIESYDPGFRSPLYPWMQILGIVAPFFLIAEMGPLAIGFSTGLLAVGGLWFAAYGRRRVQRSGAVFHVFARLGRHGLDAGLDGELREILKEKGLRAEDPFDEVVAHAPVVEVPPEGVSFEALIADVSARLAARVPATAAELEAGFLEGTRIGATPVSKGAALPHLRLFGIDRPELVLVRSRAGMHVEVTDVHGGRAPDQPIHALFFLVSPEAEPKQHLRILAQIAERVDEDGFMRRWQAAGSERELKEILHREERYLSLRVRRDGPGAELVGRALRDLDLPPGALVALIRRRGETLVPRGATVLEEGDRLTVLGAAEDVRALRDRYASGES
jgi:basic amino acid/polyamine antiporter, APA family